MRRPRTLASLPFVKDHSNNPLIDELYKKIDN